MSDPVERARELLAELADRCETQEREIERLRAEITSVEMRRESAERVCWALDDIGIRCPLCDASADALPTDHASRCEWKRWRLGSFRTMRG